MERREFLAGGAALAAVPMATLARVALADGEDGTAVASALSGSAAGAASDPAAWRALVDRHVLFLAAGRGVKLRLVRVIDASSAASPQLRQFSLVFAGPAPAMAAGTREADAPGMPRQLLYLDRAGTQAGEVLYRADFGLL